MYQLFEVRLLHANPAMSWSKFESVSNCLITANIWNRYPPYLVLHQKLTLDINENSETVSIAWLEFFLGFFEITETHLAKFFLGIPVENVCTKYSSQLQQKLFLELGGGLWGGFGVHIYFTTILKCS